MPLDSSAAVQDYLKAIFLLSEESEQVATTALAQRLGVSAASTTNMLKRLASSGMVRHSPYRGAELTPRGRAIALEVIRHHRLLETYLAEAMGVPWDQVHAEAEVLEHVLSEELEERISALLGHPTADPHGHPIPAKDGTMPTSPSRTLWDLDDGESAAIEVVSDDEAEALRFLGQIGLRPGATVLVIRRGPVSGPLFVRVEGTRATEHALSKELAEAVWVA